MKKTTQLLMLLLLICWSNAVLAQSLTLQKNWWQPNGKVSAITKHPTQDIVYIGGDFTSVSAGTPYAASLNTITNVPTFVNAAPNNTVYVSIKDGKGGWYLGGDFTRVGDSVRNRIAHINQFGEVTSLFSNYGLDSSVNALALSGDSLFIGGNFKGYGNGASQAFGAFINEGDNSILTSFPTINGKVNTSISDNNGGWFIGGSFTEVGGKFCTNVAHINAKGDVINWPCQIIGEVYSLALYGNQVVIGGVYTAINGEARKNLASVNTTTGALTSWNPNVNNKVSTMAIAGNNLYLGGEFDMVNGLSRKYLASFNMASYILTNWNPIANSNVNKLAVANNNLYVGGNFTSMGTQSRKYLAAFDISSGSLTSWNPEANNKVDEICIKNNKAYISGWFSLVNGQTRNTCAAIELSTGNLTAWNPNINWIVNAISVNSSGVYLAGNKLTKVDTLAGSTIGLMPISNQTIYTLTQNAQVLFIGGTFKSLVTGNVTNLVAYNVASNVPLNWKPQIGIVNALGILNNTLYVGGNFNAVASQTRYNACAFNLPNLQLLPWNGGLDICKPKKIITADNSLYLAGYGVIFKVNAQTGVLEWYKNLSIDLAGSINVTAICLTNNVLYWGGMYYNVLGQPSDIWIGKMNTINGNPISNVIPRIGGNAINEIVADTMSDLLYLAGNLNSFFNEPCSNVVTLKLSDNTIGSIKPNVNGTVYSLHVLDNSLFLGGSFTSVGGISRNHAAAYNINTGALTDWNPNITGSTVNAIAVKDNQVFIAGNFNKVGTQVRNNLVSVDATDATVNPLLANTNYSVRALLLSNNTLYAAGDFTSMNDVTREKLAAINLLNNTLTNWNPGANNTVTSLATYNGLIYAGGAFTGIGNKNRNYLAAIDNTGNAISWDANLNNAVNSLIIDNATLYAGGVFTLVGNEIRSNLASFNLTNNTLNNWLCNTNGAVHAMAVQGNNLLLGGVFTSIANQNRYNIAAVNKTVSEQLTSWSPVVTGNKVACILTTDSMVFIGGDYRAIGGLNSPNFSVYSDKIFPTNTDFLTTDLQSLQVVEQGATLPIQVQSNTNWRVVSSASWLTSNFTNSSNNQVITVTAQANLTPHIRSAYISISTGVVTKYVIVKQDANTTLLSFSSDTLWYKYAGGMQAVTINCNRTWSAQIADNWVVSNINSDSLTKVIEVTLAANSNKLRLSEITITAGLISKSIKIVQEGLDSALTISADTMWFDGLGGTQAVVVSSYQNWVVNLFDSWVATSRFSGIGTGTNQIIVEQNNTSLPRTAKLEWISDTIKRNLVIMQDGFVGLTENKRDDFKLYPNPSTGNFILENPSAQVIQVQVYDVLGKQYLDETMPAQSNQSFKMDAQPGVYFVKLSTQQSQQIIKLVVQ